MFTYYREQSVIEFTKYNISFSEQPSGSLLSSFYVLKQGFVAITHHCCNGLSAEKIPKVMESHFSGNKQYMVQSVCSKDHIFQIFLNQTTLCRSRNEQFQRGHWHCIYFFFQLLNKHISCLSSPLIHLILSVFNKEIILICLLAHN